MCIHGEVRLFGGSVSYGNIGVAEVCINGKWADICDDVNNKATISTTFCRQLIGEPCMHLYLVYIRVMIIVLMCI